MWILKIKLLLWLGHLLAGFAELMVQDFLTLPFAQPLIAGAKATIKTLEKWIEEDEP